MRHPSTAAQPGHMGIVQRLVEAVAGPRLAEPTGEERALPAAFTRSGGVLPPSRPASTTHVSPDQSLMILDVFRGIQIITTSVSQLSIDDYSGDRKAATQHALVRRPSLNLDRSHFFEETTLALATCGNAYWRHIVSPLGVEVVDLQPLNPAEVIVEINVETLEHKYHWRGQHIPSNRISHLKLMRRTGVALGLGPIQAAQMELAGTVDARNYAAQWLSTTDIPTGILTTDQALTPADAATYKTLWRGDGEQLKGHEIRVLGAGLRYSPIALKPADVQFLETRQFNRTGIATLLGIPPSLLNAPVEGGSKTYQNTEDEFIIFNRFTLMLYLRPIEIALSALLPEGHQARFNVEALLRVSTSERYTAHKTGIEAGFLQVNEVRAIEGLPPLTTIQTPEASRADA